MTYELPPITALSSKVSIDDAINPYNTNDGICETLYHTSDANSNKIYEKFISSTIPSVLWPEHSFNTPLHYNNLNF